MTNVRETLKDTVAEVMNSDGQSDIVLVCEHASSFIPTHLNNLGLTGAALTSHAAYDPGAAGVAKEMARLLDAPLVASRISRLVYDCNRPPDAPSAMPERSEVFEISGNMALSSAARQARVETYYNPFRALVARTIAAKRKPMVVTVHSFTPVYHGALRTCEIGILHDDDTRLADAMLEHTDASKPYVVRRNEPYGPEDGVTHTIQEHALPLGAPNVMIEVRNDLIRTEREQRKMAALLTKWIGDAVSRLEPRS